MRHDPPMTFVEQRDVLCAFVYALTGALHPEQRRVLRNNLLTAAEAFAAGSGRTPELLRLCAASVESAAPPTFGH